MSSFTCWIPAPLQPNLGQTLECASEIQIVPNQSIVPVPESTPLGVQGMTHPLLDASGRICTADTPVSTVHTPSDRSSPVTFDGIDPRSPATIPLSDGATGTSDFVLKPLRTVATMQITSLVLLQEVFLLSLPERGQLMPVGLHHLGRSPPLFLRYRQFHSLWVLMCN